MKYLLTADRLTPAFAATSAIVTFSIVMLRASCVSSKVTPPRPQVRDSPRIIGAGVPIVPWAEGVI
ncbi:hypothetical protein ACFSDD_25290 [Salipiger marinus]|uniref:hypothetical protein n=1 Tax=Salipiger marinus TaxID=555512 RepID=UPI002C85D847|nr:hypothetical protein [Salipiger manganoxidans]MEB3419853.1 hypothetical protein [Salipiger manganoxidans]